MNHLPQPQEKWEDSIPHGIGNWAVLEVKQKKKHSEICHKNYTICDRDDCTCPLITEQKIRQDEREEIAELIAKESDINPPHDLCDIEKIGECDCGKQYFVNGWQHCCHHLYSLIRARK